MTAVTAHSDRRRPAAGRVLLLALLPLAGAACGSAAATKHDLAKPDDAMVQKLAETERAYRRDSDDYPAMRDQLIADPVGAGWLTRLFVRDLFTVREGRPLGEDEELLRAAADIDDPVEKRAIEQIAILGGAAVPVLVGDLLLHGQPQPRELGIELLGYVGQPALPRLLEVSKSGDPRHRRAAARALAHFTTDPAAYAALRTLTEESDYTVRADAVRGLTKAPADAAPLLQSVLQNDGDPFVRRVAAIALRGHPGQQTAMLLVDYLERCKAELDTRGYEAAQESLQLFAGSRGPRTVEAWRRWAATQPLTKNVPR